MKEIQIWKKILVLIIIFVMLTQTYYTDNVVNTIEKKEIPGLVCRSQEDEDWVNLMPLVTPPARYHAWGQTTYDSQADRIILFGGEKSTYGYLFDTWAYDYNTNTWENRTTPQMVNEGKCIACLAYDSESDRIIMFGGTDENYFFGSSGIGETWSYDYANNNWTEMTPTISPPARGGHSMSYDEVNDRIIMYGGFTEQIYLNNAPFYHDTWAYDYNTNTWTNLNPINTPPPLGDHESVYDSESDKTIIFTKILNFFTTANNSPQFRFLSEHENIFNI